MKQLTLILTIAALFLLNNTAFSALKLEPVDPEILKKVKKEHLPEALQNLSPAERETYVKKLSTQRADIRAKIGKLAAQRDTYAAKERKRLAKESDDATLGEVVVLAVQKQLAKSGFKTAPSNE